MDAATHQTLNRETPPSRRPAVGGPASRTLDLFANTTLAPPRAPRQRLTPFQRYQRDRLRAQRQRLAQAAIEDAEGYAAMYAHRRQQILLGREADRAWDELKAYQHDNLERVVRAFRFARLRFKVLALLSVEYRVLHRAFEEHLQNAMLASPAEVRRWDIISWFKLPPELAPLSKAIDDMVEYCHEEASLRLVHHDAESKHNLTTHEHVDLAFQPCHPHATFTMLSDKDRRFGYEEEINKYGFGDDEDVPTWPGKIRILRARFEVRKIRLAHADTEDRFGFSGPTEEDWTRSLDGQMMAWSEGMLDALSPQSIMEKVYNNITSAFSPIIYAERTSRIQSIISVSSSLFRELVAYETALDTRKTRFLQTYDRMSLALRQWEAGGKGAINRFQALQIGTWMNAFRAALAQAVNVRQDDIEYELFTELMEEVNEAM